MKQMTISPVTRVEGHGEVRIDLNDRGEVERAHFSVVELRGFERFLVGAAVEEAPRITPRICGICPTSHHLAAAKALDQIFGAEPPEAGKKLRELMMLGQYIHSHALHFFMLAAPDYLLPGAGEGDRNVMGLAKGSMELVKKAIAVRKFGQRITEAVGGKPIHPATGVPGGVSHPIQESQRASLLQMAEGVLAAAIESWEIAHSLMDKIDPSVGLVNTAFMGMQKGGLFTFDGGQVQVCSPEGTTLGSFSGADYVSQMEEYTEDWSYLKFCRLKAGQPYRVGPLARLNIVNSMGTSEADKALAEYRKKYGRVVQTTLAYNIARYVEFLWACERAKELLQDSALTAQKTRTPVEGVVNRRGVGIIEAPRGTLIHDYTVNEAGIIERCNLIVATCQNNYAMDRSVEEVARRVIRDGKPIDGGVNLIESVIRAYDPCLSCATHMIKTENGRMASRPFIKICISGVR
ncbi:MAG: Ni/Fe hydrogenase subunit alpha [Methanomicrobiales archaeon]|nr:Ni/Fe hydrogenase subunit alpha [Methanomicrobiales archaeon]